MNTTRGSIVGKFAATTNTYPPHPPSNAATSLQQAMSVSCFDPEYIAIILAATEGARLFPLTSEFPGGVPKHLLPISPLNTSSSSGGASATLLQRLLVRTYESGFEMVVIAIHKEDNVTIPYLLGRSSSSSIEESLVEVETNRVDCVKKSARIVYPVFQLLLEMKD